MTMDATAMRDKCPRCGHTAIGMAFAGNRYLPAADRTGIRCSNGMCGWMETVTDLRRQRNDLRDQVNDLRDQVNDLRDQVNDLRDQVNDLNLTLVELVMLKDHVKHDDPDAYERRKPKAWQQARELLHATTLGEAIKRTEIIHDPAYTEMHEQLFELDE